VIAAPGGASRAFLRDPPLDQLLISDPLSVERFIATMRTVIRAPGFFRQKVNDLARPRLPELMSPKKWWHKFIDVSGL
jgi:hypothetical protein